MRWVIAGLIMLTGWIAWLVYVVLPAHSSRLFGGFFLAIGVPHVIFYRRNGRKFFAKTQTSRPFVANFWARSGEKGIQLLFLGFGITLAVAGCVLIVMGST